eukprot:CAMPEP_0170501352 /NCGR_PEP_ID=MMETSP0208-20121228/37971_1 /TAXON_ID=197538 /ORGANISM="Strombidium inclinatum, Strain S3" /LENGTH=147 /DNA_ID=CAMNT_0010779839 /DNA_START=3417 /DNA_END=3860 /DNA_ORIENTATION=-
MEVATEASQHRSDWCLYIIELIAALLLVHQRLPFLEVDEGLVVWILWALARLTDRLRAVYSFAHFSLLDVSTVDLQIVTRVVLGSFLQLMEDQANVLRVEPEKRTPHLIRPNSINLLKGHPSAKHDVPAVDVLGVDLVVFAKDYPDN